MIKTNILIVGFGNIGKRHLESFLKVNTELNIYCVDKILKKEKFKFNDKNIFYQNTFEKIPEIINICIISTTSTDRLRILKNTLKKFKVNKLILEKVVFKNMNEYNCALNLISPKDKIYINCPRRTWESYIELKKELIKNSLISIEVQGYKWGLLSNLIHFIDLFVFLSGDKNVELIYDNFSTLFETKRKSFFEVLGTFIFKNKNNNLLIVQDDEIFKKDSLIRVITNKYIYEINESSKKIKRINKDLKSYSIKNFNSYYQSEISKNYLKQIKLVTIKKSKKSHIALYKCFEIVFPNKRDFPIT